MYKDDEEQERRIELMKTQIDLYPKQARWEVIKGLAAILGAAAAIAGTAVGLAALLHHWYG